MNGVSHPAESHRLAAQSLGVARGDGTAPADDAMTSKRHSREGVPRSAGDPPGILQRRVTSWDSRRGSRRSEVSGSELFSPGPKG